MSCQTCYPLQYIISPSYNIPAGLKPSSNYYLWIYKPNSNPYSYPVTTDTSGDIIISSSDFPIGYFNQYGGEYMIQVSGDANGQFIDNVNLSMGSWPCILLTFVCNEC